MNQRVVRSLIAVGVVGVALALIPTVRAGGKEKKEEKRHPGAEFFEGKISAIDAKARTVTIVKKPGSMTFTIAPDCKFYVKEKKAGATFDDFKVGDTASVLYQDVNGTLMVSRLAEAGTNPDHREKKGL